MTNESMRSIACNAARLFARYLEKRIGYEWLPISWLAHDSEILEQLSGDELQQIASQIRNGPQIEELPRGFDPPEELGDLEMLAHLLSCAADEPSEAPT